jgi:tRNA threonylcarbamoyladenosine biosynthesis protein TsaB
VSVVLAIETSQRTASIALVGADGEVLFEPLAAARRHDDDLVPAIDRLFDGAGVAPGSLEVVGVSVGPGGFTGLRIAVAAAKMMALSLEARIVAVPSALVAAEACTDERASQGPIMVALASKRGSFWATKLAAAADGWQIDDDRTGLVDAETVALDGLTAVLADEHLPDIARTRCTDAGIPVIEPVLDARACLAITRRRAAAQDFTDPLKLAPIYPRPPEAVRLFDKA